MGKEYQSIVNVEGIKPISSRILFHTDYSDGWPFSTLATTEDKIATIGNGAQQVPRPCVLFSSSHLTPAENAEGELILYAPVTSPMSFTLASSFFIDGTASNFSCQIEVSNTVYKWRFGFKYNNPNANLLYEYGVDTWNEIDDSLIYIAGHSFVPFELSYNCEKDCYTSFKLGPQKVDLSSISCIKIAYDGAAQHKITFTVKTDDEDVAYARIGPIALTNPLN